MIPQRVKMEAQESEDQRPIKVEPGTMPSDKQNEPQLMQLPVASVSSTQGSHSLATATATETKVIAQIPQPIRSEFGNHAGAPSEAITACRYSSSSETLVSAGDTSRIAGSCFPNKGENVESQFETRSHNAKVDKWQFTWRKPAENNSDAGDHDCQSDSEDEGHTPSGDDASFEPDSESDDETNEYECVNGERKKSNAGSKKVRLSFIDTDQHHGR
jgi:hypothetical protein